MAGYYAKMRGLQDRRRGVDWTFFAEKQPYISNITHIFQLYLAYSMSF